MNKFNFKHVFFIKFLFPLFPLKLSSSIKLLVLFSLLVALRLIIQRFSIPIPGFVMRLSFVWIVNILISWWFGPIIGMCAGFLTDTLSLLIYGGIARWFWIYAIQEPLLGLIAGSIGSLYLLLKTKKDSIFLMKYSKKWYFFKINKNFISIIINQLFLVSFVIISLVVLIYFDNKEFVFAEQKKFNTNNFFGFYRYIAIAVIVLFALFFEAVLIFLLKSKKYDCMLLCFLSTLVIINSLLFSFILGPIASVEYLKYLNNGNEPEDFLIYGYMFYFIPRVIKETIRLPILITCLLTLHLLITPIFNRFVNEAKLKWNY